MLAGHELECSQSNDTFLFITFLQCDALSALETVAEEPKKADNSLFENSMLALSRSTAGNWM